MNKTRRTLVTAMAAALAPASLVRAQSRTTPYTTLQSALPLENPAKVEIAEFFWYGCIHCYRLEPALDAWLLKLPADAYFRRIPAVFNERWAVDASIYYALEALGQLDKLHRPLFDAIHVDRLRTDNAEALGEWLTKKGIDPKKFDASMKSFGVQSKTKRASQMTGASRIDGTPALMVQGRYTISVDQGGSGDGMLAIAGQLIPVVRKALSGNK